MASSKVLPFLGAPFLVLVLLLLPNSIQSRPTKIPTKNAFEFIEHLQGCHKGETVKGLKDLKGYLHTFGYLNYHQAANNKKSKNHENDDEFDDLLESAIKSYQQYYHLKVTGDLDAETVNQMMQPRCGVPDVVINGTKLHHSHNKSVHIVGHFRFFPNRQRWPDSKTSLTYRFSSTARVPEPDKIRSIISKAFESWSKVTRFTFQEVSAASSNSDIVIGFHQGSHGDSSPFDGPRGVLAHATAPTRGLFHYDADENWSSNPAAGTTQVDLESVAVHEIGHVLGLHHSEVRNAVMFASYQPGTTKRDLDTDDIQGIQTLYGLQ